MRQVRFFMYAKINKNMEIITGNIYLTTKKSANYFAINLNDKLSLSLIFISVSFC